MLRSCRSYQRKAGPKFQKRCAVDCHDIMYEDVLLAELFEDFNTSYDDAITSKKWNKGKKFVKADKCRGINYYPTRGEFGVICTGPSKQYCDHVLPSFEAQSFSGKIRYGSYETHSWLVRDAEDHNVLLLKATSVRPWQKDVLRFQIGKGYVGIGFGIRVLYCQQGGSCSAGLEHEDIMLASESKDVRYLFWTGHEVIESKLDAGISAGRGDDYWIWIENFSGQPMKTYYIKYSGELRYVRTI